LESRIKQLETGDASIAEMDRTWSKVFEDSEPKFLGMRLLGPGKTSDDVWENREESLTVQSGEPGEVEHEASLSSDVPQAQNAQTEASPTPSEDVTDPVKDDTLDHDAESFLRLNVAHGNGYANWYSATHGLNGAAKSEGGATNEFELVVSCLTYKQEAVGISPPDREILEAQRGSYSLRLLAAVGHHQHDAPNFAMDSLGALGEEFPHLRYWSDWLRLPALDEDRKSDLLRSEHSKPGALDEDFWSGRLTLVYPGLSDLDVNAISLASVQPHSGAFERLVADVAIACAARSQPRVGSTGLADQ